ncbi:hypothetical protein [Aquimarina sp. AU474]|nr:hypothetical protein [Aquimarina sp. AU474]
MKKSILDLDGVKVIEKKAQSYVNGGGECYCGVLEMPFFHDRCDSCL